MAALAGILHNQMTSGQALRPMGANPMTASAADTGGTGSTSSSDASSADISANDFLSLLVTEMQNQDPTANTDPNEYINQLVQVNSLEQLIDINQSLSTAVGGSGSSSGAQPGSAPASGATSAVTAASHATSTAKAQAAMQKGVGLSASQTAASGAPTGDPAATFAARLKHAPGNLSVPGTDAAANRVGHGLDGRSDVRSRIGGRYTGQ